ISGSVTAASCWGIQGTHTSAKPGSAAAFRPRWIPAGCPTRCILDHTKNGIRRLTFGFQRPRNCFQGRSMPSRKWACRPTVLRALAAWQGTTEDQFRDEEPGKILHEIRYGEMTAFTERPHSPYFGAADVTPLFIVLLDEQERWTGDRGLVEELEMEAKAALLW